MRSQINPLVMVSVVLMAGLGFALQTNLAAAVLVALLTGGVTMTAALCEHITRVEEENQNLKGFNQALVSQINKMDPAAIKILEFSEEGQKQK